MTVAQPQIHRMVRVYDWTSGFPWSCATSVEQDARGFLWVSTTSGLYRFDGARARRMGGSFGIAPGSTAAKRVVLYSRIEGTFEGTSEGLKRLDRATENCDDGPLIVAVATDGTPWRTCNGRLQRLSAGG